MMGRGYFIDLNTWEVIPIAEHEMAVRSDPARYRVKRRDVSGRDRDKNLTKVLQRGFARVREHRDTGLWHLEVAHSWDDAYAAALVLARKLALPDHAMFTISNLRDLRRSPREMTVRDIRRGELGERRGSNASALRRILERIHLAGREESAAALRCILNRISARRPVDIESVLNEFVE